MKYFVLLILIFSILSACRNHSTSYCQKLENRIDGLRSELNKSYTPGFGEFMSAIQMHHIKLWYAGNNENWALADFEIKEITENIDVISQYCKIRPETKSIGEIAGPLKTVQKSIRQKSLQLFKKSFNVLTHTCVSYHQTTGHPCIRIKIPDENIFTNQFFEVRNDTIQENTANR